MTTSLSNYCINSNIQYNLYPLWLAIVYLWCYHAAIHKQRHLVHHLQLFTERLENKDIRCIHLKERKGKVFGSHYF